MSPTPETEHRFNLREEGPPHEHDTWVCECGEWWYWGGCAVCGVAPEPASVPLHCYVWCYELEGIRCIEEEAKSALIASPSAPSAPSTPLRQADKG